MIPATKNLQLYQGDSFDLLVRIRTTQIVSGQQVPGDYVDLTDAVATAQIRTTPASTDVVDDITCTIGAQSGDTLGAIDMTLTPAQTAALVPGTPYVYDLQVVFPGPNGPTNTYLSGNISVTAEVTRSAP